MTVDEVVLQTINLSVEEAWAGSQAEVETSIPQAVTVDTLVSKQAQGAMSSFIQFAESTDKDYDVSIYWPDFCGSEAQDCETDVCQDLTADQAELKKKDYVIGQCIEDKFAISETAFQKSWLNKDEFIVKNINNKIANLLTLLNKKALLFLHANAGLNNGGNYVANGSGQYVVPGIEFADTNVFAKMLYDATVSRITSPFIIDGNNLWALSFNAQMNAANANGAGDANRASLFNMITFDPLGFAQVPDVTKSTFLISPYAYAFVSKNYIKNTVPIYDEAAGKWKYSIDLGRYGARIDVFFQRICENGAKNLYKYVWVFKLHYDFFANPAGCPDESGKAVSGIIEYTRSGYGGGIIG